MDLLRRLSLLGPGRPAAAAVPAEKQATLDELRARMADILGRPPPEPVLPDPEATLLPFVRRETEHGPLCARQERLGRSHRVGRMCVDEAARADPRILALLALDPRLERNAVRAEVRRVVRRMAQDEMKQEFACDLETDDVLQRGAYELLKKLKVDPATIAEYKGFPAKFDKKEDLPAGAMLPQDAQAK